MLAGMNCWFLLCMNQKKGIITEWQVLQRKDQHEVRYASSGYHLSLKIHIDANTGDLKKHKNIKIWPILKMLREGSQQIQNVNFFQIGVKAPHPPPPLPPQNVNFLTKKKKWCPKTSSVALRTYKNTFLW